MNNATLQYRFEILPYFPRVFSDFMQKLESALVLPLLNSFNFILIQGRGLANRVRDKTTMNRVSK